jgi:hypothetical protein
MPAASEAPFKAWGSAAAERSGRLTAGLGVASITERLRLRLAASTQGALDSSGLARVCATDGHRPVDQDWTVGRKRHGDRYLFGAAVRQPVGHIYR